MRDFGDLGDRDGPLRPRYQAIGAAGLGNVALQQMSTDLAELVAHMRLARATAPPDMTMLREAKVPNPNAVLSVSPCRTEIW
jgi:hypothetical protein